MLVAVTAVSFVIGEVPTGILIALLILFNIVLGSRQELKARASVDALSKMQVPQSRVRRDGHVVQVPAGDIVPGDIVDVEAGDIVPADGRIIRSATLEAQEAALTGESAPVSKDAKAVAARRRARRPRRHAVPEHVGDARHRGHGRDGHRDGHRDGPDRDAADVGDAGALAAAARARFAHQGPRRDRVDRGRVHRRRRPDPRHGLRGARPARDGDGDLGDPHGHAGVRVRPALARRQAARRGARRRQEPHRRRDARRHERDQHRQDRHADDERDDGLDHLRRGRVVHRHRERLRQDRGRSSRSPARRCPTSRGSPSRSCSTATPP